jgi:iron-sulfur cluster assembly protein
MKDRKKIAAISITNNAADRIKHLLSTRGKPSAGIRISVVSGGCSGKKYTIEYANEVNKFDEIIDDKGVVVLIDPKAILYLVGTEMDFIDNKFKSGFVFNNPNEKSSCGCGESFNV